MVHATFQTGGLKGKVARFRENNMWKLNSPDYYSGKILSYTNHVLVHPLKDPVCLLSVQELHGKNLR
jgi:hypothetical protein